MKKLLLTVFVLVMSITAFAQNSSEHLLFKGIPIDGPLNQFVSKLQSDGYTLECKDADNAVLSGTFAGRDNCYLYVVVKNKLVAAVMVMFPKGSNWNALEIEYSIFKNALTDKYGEPIKVVEQFQGYIPTLDSTKYQKLIKGECEYSTHYMTDKGMITLGIQYIDNFGPRVFVFYGDLTNNIMSKLSDLSDL